MTLERNHRELFAFSSTAAVYSYRTLSAVPCALCSSENPLSGKDKRHRAERLPPHGKFQGRWKGRYGSIICTVTGSLP